MTTHATRHLTSIFDLSAEEVRRLFDLTTRVTTDPEAHNPVLAGRCVGMLFQKPSMRTRVSFETAVANMSGHTIFLTDGDVGVGSRERADDFARVISSYVDGLVVRTFSHELVVELADHAACPIVNGLSDYLHPCQALADLWTMRKHLGRLEGRTMVFVGDGNNVARSLAAGAARLGVRFVLSAPEGYDLDEAFLARLAEEEPNHRVEQIRDPQQAAAEADVIYTDVWASMGQEDEAAKRQADFAPYQVNAELLAQAKPDALVMHCLPAHREEEITSDVLDGPQSIVMEQAANRLPLQKALLRWLMVPETC